MRYAMGIMRSFATPVFATFLIVIRVSGQPSAANYWPVSTPESLGLDPQVLAQLDADIAAGKYGNTDSMLISSWMIQSLPFPLAGFTLSFRHMARRCSSVVNRAGPQPFMGARVALRQANARQGCQKEKTKVSHRDTSVKILG